MSKSASLQIEKRVWQNLEDYIEVSAPRFIVAVSGGPDSMALLYTFHKLNVDSIVAHINYGKRAEESEKDAELVEQMAYEWGFDCHSVKVDPEEADNKNFQQWARKVRYEVFRSLAEEYDADGIALAHHEDDQVETILQKLFRGSGLESWSAMDIWDGELFRPLLETGREEIMKYCVQQAIPYRIDKSNLSSEFARNFLRNEWLERLDQHFPGWKENVKRLPAQAELFSTALDWISNQITDDRDCLDRDQFISLEPELAQALILKKMKEVHPGIELNRDALSEIDKLQELQTGKAIQLTENYEILRDRERFKIVYNRPDALKLLELKQDELENHPFSLDNLVFEIGSCEDPDFENALYLDIDKLEWPLTLRNWKSGDAFQPLGMEGHQKVSDHLTNRKVSASEKNSALVIVSFDETICAIIFPPIENRRPPGTIAESVKCDHTTDRCLIIK
ncbi:tRNA lysidine(34) synthetase TilS [Balneolaceae bacterium YR4-1]|uniref:tRNA(Ile)-lysidine synthase n=1 Tax=Halalkalibaculum roseum TaxID=2709311 RepID=A0A6M1T022_9BACT|nr:tRNA lysidine(34) synthetase TilS [Halalkalibaculum roseum]NGP78018.1 tRNA lysidine(34) synthetase TilS [Halalkalibaculum roseum]